MNSTPKRAKIQKIILATVESTVTKLLLYQIAVIAPQAITANPAINQAPIGRNQRK